MRALGFGGGTSASVSVALSGGTTGLTAAGSPITNSGTITLGGTLSVANGGTGATTNGAARTNLGLNIGSDVQAYNATLSTVAGGTYTGAASITTLGTVATGTWNANAIAIANGGTGATTNSAARTNLGLNIGSDVQAYNATLSAVAGGTYTGAASITTLGTVATGTWNAGAVTSSGAVTSTTHIPTGATAPANGLYLPAANQIGLATNSASALQIDSAQRTLLGHTASITTNTQSPKLQIAGTDSNSATIGTYRFSANATQPRMTLNKSRNATLGSHTVLNNGDAIGSIDFNGSDGTNFTSSSQLLAETDGSSATNIVPGRTRFLTANASGALTEAMRIDSKQNVVHGTATLATTATGGFPWFPSCAGTPTGAPAAPYTNAAAVVVDTTGSKLWVLVGSAWKSVALA